jgi:hypothetical protein
MEKNSTIVSFPFEGLEFTTSIIKIQYIFIAISNETTH